MFDTQIKNQSYDCKYIPVSITEHAAYVMFEKMDKLLKIQ